MGEYNENTGYSEDTENTEVASDVQNQMVGALLKIIEQETSPEMQQLKLQIIRKIALQNYVVPSRIQAPKNITQIGGYINLMRKLGYDDMTKQMLASVLGLPMQHPNE